MSEFLCVHRVSTNRPSYTHLQLMKAVSAVYRGRINARWKIKELRTLSSVVAMHRTALAFSHAYNCPILLRFLLDLDSLLILPLCVFVLCLPPLSLLQPLQSLKASAFISSRHHQHSRPVSCFACVAAAGS